MTKPANLNRKRTPKTLRSRTQSYQNSGAKKYLKMEEGERPQGLDLERIERDGCYDVFISLVIAMPLYYQPRWPVHIEDFGKLSPRSVA
ncbi:hypothetical protein EDM53_05330 [Rickettsiales endosymbiont of Peranema trichophorum]|uniref:hypothetical protein n=1 Tax=Rickettsiales endosymbiont of Peranema trichophorum TaxID=2486577 RepID=UPI0010236A43|nr:hypothetical protein [Rickettsiales endosymbiont of Peranema trichophorum]RZI45394.1 hypothetical protein EDM53_05330 [Rickettsiales endosymbiont of Peranema trichophorum]